MRVILTHDVDSIKKPLRHILKVRKRFSIRDIIKHVIGLKNLYNNMLTEYVSAYKQIIT